jgi:hypothetical protein
MLYEHIRSGDWVDASRLRIYPRIYLSVSLAMTITAVAFGHSPLDLHGNPLGTDFLSFWSASNLLWQGRPEAAYDHAALYAIEQSVGGPDCPLYTWLYPPMAFLVVAPLAALPYFPALTAWLGITFIGYLTALWQFLPDRRTLIPMIAFPPVFINLGHGQNAFLSAALLGWGLILLPRRPWLAGILMGALIYKPQLGLLLPVALLAAGHWRALFGAVVSVVVLSAASYGLLGAEVWAAFLAKSEYSRQVLEQGLVPWQKMISSFAAARMLGAPVGLAWAMQTLVSLSSAAVVWRVWRAPTSYPVKVATVTIGTLLAAPLALDYDATVLGIAITALAADGLRRRFLDWEISILAGVWMTSLLWRPIAMATDIPLGALAIMLLLWLTMRRARRVG